MSDSKMTTPHMGSENIAGETGIHPIRLRPEFRDKRPTLELETSLGFVLLPEDWNGVPSRAAIALGLDRVAETAISPDMLAAAAFLRSLAAAFRHEDSGGWRAEMKGKPGPKPTREEKAERSKRLVQIGQFYRARYADLGPGCSRAAEIDTANEFRCSRAVVAEGVQELRRVEELFDEIQRLIGDPVEMEMRLRSAQTERQKQKKPDG